MATALFVCLHNAGRSQMSAALFERAAAGRHHALSAGTTPGDRVHPEVVEVMRELGIDLADRKPQLLTRELAGLGVAWHFVEAAVSIAAGLAAGSIALIGFGADSLVEAFAGFIVLWRFAGARAGSDRAERRAQQLVAVTFYV